MVAYSSHWEQGPFTYGSLPPKELIPRRLRDRNCRNVGRAIACVGKGTMPKVKFQRRIAELDYTVAQPKRARSFRGVVALIVLALVAMAVFASIHLNAPDDFARLGGS